MNNLHIKTLLTILTIITSFSIVTRGASAAGSLDMQIERAIVKALKDYNGAMSENNPASWLKYFDKNAVRTDPISGSIKGLENITSYYSQEFSLFKASLEIQRVMLKERTGAVEMVWQASHNSTETIISLPMVGIFELAPSGKFKSATFYFDTAMNNNVKIKAIIEQLKMP